MPYCIYLRKSRADLDAEARGEGESLARHEAALLSLAASRGLTVTQIYREIVSGETISARPEVQKMLHEVEAGLWEGVLVMEVERLARGNTIDQGIVAQAFQTTGTKIVTPIKIYDPNNEFDQEYFEFGLFMSRREFVTINRRMQRGRIASVQEGNFLGSKPPFGYDLHRTPDKRHTLKINQEQAPTVQLIFDLFTGDHTSDLLPMGCSLIAKYLNDKAISTATGGKWIPCVIRTILTNPVYIGKIRWNNRQTVKKVTDGVVYKHRPRTGSQPMIVQGIHPAIITEEQFQKVSSMFESNKQPTGPKPTGTPNPLLKLVKCRCCGKNMIKRPDQRSSRTQLICPTTGCPTVGSPLEVVEEMILSSLEEWMEKFKLANAKTKEPTEIKKIDSLIGNISKKLSTLSAQESRTYDLLEQGIYTTDIFLSRQKELASQRSDLQCELQKLEQRKHHLEQMQKGKSQIIPNIEYVLTNYHTAAPEEKNRMLRRVIDYVTYEKTQRMNPKTKKGGDLSVTITPKF
ncbi:MAG: recombinase family protein [Clostridia bacterium]|nr:recombinase family protein [Clostridia bacterium]